MSEDTQTVKTVHIGPKMREAYAYVKQHPGELEYVIQKHFGRSGKEIVNRLVAAEMITVTDNRCYVREDRERYITRAKATNEHNMIRQYSYDGCITVPCTNRECLASPGDKCTGQTRFGRDRIGPHYERYVVAFYCAMQEIEQKDAELAELRAMVKKLQGS